MRRVPFALFVLALLALILTWLPQEAFATPPSAAPATTFVPGEILVQWRPGASPNKIAVALADLGAEHMGTIAGLGVDRLRVRPGREWTAIARLRANALVVYAEPNYIARAAHIPNDPGYWRQWNMERVAAAKAWDFATGDPDLKVAVIDSGVQTDHPDLAPRIQGGWDYVRGDPVPDDEYGHGTHVVGIVGAVTDNGLGVAGMSWQGWLLPYKVLNQDGLGTYADIAAAIVSAQASGARIINLSLGGSAPSQTLLNAVDAAYRAGILLVAATGNNNGPVNYPAAYTQVLAVGATTDLDRYAWYSNYGPEVDVAAPGGLPETPIYSTIPNGYGFLYGTSMATAHVSGVAALIWSLAPYLSRDDVRQIIEGTVDQVDADSHPYTNGRNNYLGRGRINAERAVRSVLPPRIEASTTEVISIVSLSQPRYTRRLVLQNPSLQPMNWQAQVLAGSRWLSLLPPTSGSLVYPTTTSLSLQIDASGMVPGTYVGLIRVTGTSGAGSQQLDIYVQLQVTTQVQRLFLPQLIQQ